MKHCHRYIKVVHPFLFHFF